MGKKLKILQAVFCLGRGGAEKLSVEITDELNKRENIEALLVSFEKAVSYEYSTENINYQYCPVKVDLSLIGKNHMEVNNFIDIVNRFKPDIIHSHRYQTEIATREFIFDNIKYFSHLHTNMPVFQKFNMSSLFKKSRLANYYEKKRLQKKYKQCNNYFIAVSENTYNYGLKVMKIPPTNIKLIPSGIDVNKFSPLSKNTDNNFNKLITVGNLTDVKDHLFLIEVVRCLHDDNIHICLDICGEGPNRKKIQDKIREYDLDKYITLHGNVENPEYYLNQADIYVHSSVYESFGLALLEAMACRLPVVTTDAMGNRDILEDGKNGFMIRTRSVKKFAEKIKFLIDNPDVYNKLSSYALKYSENYNLKNYIDKLLDYYYSVL